MMAVVAAPLVAMILVGVVVVVVVVASWWVWIAAAWRAQMRRWRLRGGQRWWGGEARVEAARAVVGWRSEDVR